MIRRHAIAVAVVLVVAVSSLSAATFEPISDAQLVDRADLVVVAHVLDAKSRAVGRSIVTDYRLSVEEVVKGQAEQSIITVTELGGSANGLAMVIPGSARYVPGSRVVAFLRQRPDGSFFTASMALGRLRFELLRDGREVLRRDTDDAEIDDPNAFAPRAADSFLGFIRDVAAGRAAAAQIAPVTVVPDANRPSTPQTNAASDYVFKDGSPQKPIRWKNCEAGCTINYKLNGQQPGTANIPAGIEAAMDAWNNHADSFVNLQLSGLTLVTDVSNFDNENSIVLNNTDSPSIGQCDGTIACGIVWLNDNPCSDANCHTFRGTEFYNALQGDVILRPVSMTQAVFDSILAHELGHTLALRHSNVGTPSSTNALMNSTVPTTGATLRQWDRDAMAEVYGNGLPCVQPTVNSTSGGGTVTFGNTRQLSVNASGTTPLTYQWFEGTSGTTTNPVGTNSSNFTTPPITQTRNFWVRVTNQCGTASSPTITVTPTSCTPPSITQQPSSQTITPGQTATLTVDANGTSPFTYQWFEGPVGVTTNPVSTSKTFVTPPLQTTKSYWVRVKNNCGETNSQLATITVNSSCVPPTITQQPVSQNITPGQTATLNVEANGTAPLSYQWFEGPVGVTTTPVSTSKTFVTPPLQTTKSYWVRVKNHCGEVNSQLATITVGQQCVAASIVTQPSTINVTLGNGATLNVVVGGTAPHTFQWFQGESGDMTNPLVGQTASSFAAGPFHTPGSFKFWVRVTNACGAVNSATITVSVGCPSLDALAIFAPPVSLAAAGYDVSWTGITPAQASSFELQEATDIGFTSNLRTFIVTGAQFRHIDAHTEILTDTRFYYRVRATNACNQSVTPFSSTISTLVTGVQPPNSTEFSVSLPEGVEAAFTQNYLVPGFGDTATANDTFAITTDVPWLTVFPASGALSAGGTTVQFTFNTTGLVVGSTTGTISVDRTNGSAKVGTNGTTPTVTVPFTISLVTPVTPAPRSAVAPPGTLIIPAIAHADGINTRFQSDVRIANTSDQPISYELSFTQSGTNGTQAGKRTTLTVPARDTLGLDDVVKAWFGAGTAGEGGLGTLEIRPLNGANPLSTFASSRTYALDSSTITSALNCQVVRCTLGQYIPAIPLESFIGNISANPLAKISLQQIANSTAYRTNFGFVEGGGETVDLLAKLLDGNNNVLQQVTRRLQPFSHEQISFLSLFGNVPVNDGRLEVSVTSPGGKVTAYASVIDNSTSDPLLVFPVQPAAFTSQRYVAPGIAELNNGTANFHSDMRIFNGGATAVAVNLRYFEQGTTTPNPLTVPLTIASGEVKAIDNVLPLLWNLNASGGAVTIDAPSDASLVVTARTFSRDANGGTFGQFIPGVTSRDATGLGEPALELLQLEESAQYRTNLGVVEVTGNGATIEITATKPDTKLSAVTSLTLGPNEFRQFGFIFRSLGLPTVYNGRVSVKVIGGQGRVASYGSVIDNRTVDPTYVPAQ